VAATDQRHANRRHEFLPDSEHHHERLPLLSAPESALTKIDSKGTLLRVDAFFDGEADSTQRRKGARKNYLTVGGSSKGENCVSSKGENLEGVISQDFGPGIPGWERGLSHGPELSSGMMNEGDCSTFGRGNGPTAA
jgi:hypothetical protein